MANSVRKTPTICESSRLRKARTTLGLLSPHFRKRLFSGKPACLNHDIFGTCYMNQDREKEYRVERIATTKKHN